MRHYPLALQIALCVSLIPAAFAQEEVAITNVTVWVRATDGSGKPITGLTQNEFEVFEDNKKMELTCFEEVRFPVADPTDAQQQTATAVPAEAARKRIVLLLDLHNTSEAEFLHLKKNASDFLGKLEGNWEGMVISFYPQGIMEVNVEPTEDFIKLESALERLRANFSRDIDTIHNRRTIQDAMDSLKFGLACGLAKEYAEQEYILARGWIQSLHEFDRYLRRQDDKSHVVAVLLSGGIAANPGRHYFDVIRNHRSGREMNMDERGFEEQMNCDFEESSTLRKRLESTIAQLNRNNITFYTVNSRGPINLLLDTVMESGRKLQKRDFEFLDDYQDHMSAVATRTGGTYFENSTNFRFGFEKILTDLNHQYLLCYRPPPHKDSGEHSIKVKARRSGVKLRHRTGYAD